LESGWTSHSVFKIPITIGREGFNVLDTCVERFYWVAPRSKVDRLGWSSNTTSTLCQGSKLDFARHHVTPYLPFSKKVVDFGGDFRQCPLVVSRDFRAVIVFATLSLSVLSHQVCVLTFTKNMRLNANPLSRP
jgi:hypothetical protein